MEVNDRVLALSVLPNRGSTLNCSTCKGPFPFVLQQALMVLPEDCTNPFLLLPSIPSTDSSKIYIYIYMHFPPPLASHYLLTRPKLRLLPNAHFNTLRHLPDVTPTSVPPVLPLPLPFIFLSFRDYSNYNVAKRRLCEGRPH